MADKAYNVDSLKGTATIAAGTTVGTVTLGKVEGVTKTIFFTTPDMEDSDSTNFQIVNSAGAAFMTSGTKAESVTSVVGTEVALVEGDKIIVTAEGTQSAQRAITYDIRLLR